MGAFTVAFIIWAIWQVASTLIDSDGGRKALALFVLVVLVVLLLIAVGLVPGRFA